MNLEWFENTVRLHVDPSRKLVLQYRGYLVYVAVTYPFLRPYMKSMHLSVESYRETKDKYGWERHLIKSEPDPAIKFAREERNIVLIRLLFRLSTVFIKQLYRTIDRRAKVGKSAINLNYNQIMNFT
jgi:hypothetical protein